MKPLECEMIKAARESGLIKALGLKFKDKYNDDEMKDLYKKSEQIQKNHPDDDVRQYLFWRNKAITVMIKDCVKATYQRLTNIDSVDKVLSHEKRLVDVSNDLKDAWRGNDGFYNNVMGKILFNHRIVRKHTYNAGQKVRTLFDIYNNKEGYKLVPNDYKNMTRRIYKDYDFGVSEEKNANGESPEEEVFKVLTIKNYIAGMSDAFINQVLKDYTE